MPRQELGHKGNQEMYRSVLTYKDRYGTDQQRFFGPYPKAGTAQGAATYASPGSTAYKIDVQVAEPEWVTIKEIQR